MDEESKTASYSVAPSPSYAEAMECVQLSPRHLTQVMLEQQWNINQDINATAANDPEEAFANEERKKKDNNFGQWYLQLAVFVLLTFVVIWVACLL